MKIKIGIIGFGRMGITHYSIINSHPNVEITCVADTSNLILSLLKKYISGLNTYTDFHELLNIENVDAVLICTPPNLHYEIIKLCAEKNIHVFVEKPFTTEYSKAKELSDIFNKKGLINQVGYVNRYNDVFKKTKEFIDKSLIGEIIRFRSEMFSRTIIEADDNSGWRAKRESGGGVVFDMAAHSIDLVNYIIGIPDKIIGSNLNVIFSKDIEDAVSSTFLYKNGITGTIYVNWSDESYRKPTNKIEIFGKKGKILADQHSLKIYLKEANKQYNLREGWNTLYITDIFESVPFYVRGNEFSRQLYNFVEDISNNKNQNLCAFKDGANTLEVIEGIFSDYFNNGRI